MAKPRIYDLVNEAMIDEKYLTIIRELCRDTDFRFPSLPDNSFLILRNELELINDLLQVVTLILYEVGYGKNGKDIEHPVLRQRILSVLEKVKKKKAHFMMLIKPITDELEK